MLPESALRAPDPGVGAHRASLLQTWPLALLMALILFELGLAEAPIPGVNESHWLGKARAFWDANFCPNDFFYQSGNAHFVFLALIGLPAQVLSLASTALLGRAVAAIALGFAMSTLVRPPTAAVGLLTLALFSLTQWLGNLSGEWILGGVEAKQFSYAFLFASLAAFETYHYRRSASMAGLAVALHPVVGGWGLLGVLLIALRSLAPFQGNRDKERPLSSQSLPEAKLNVRELLICGGLVVACAVPGLIPAWSILRSATDAQVAHAATIEQVFGRLRHHLDPTDFGVFAYAYYGVLLVVWLALRRSFVAERLPRAFLGMVTWSLMIAVIGLLAGWGAYLADRFADHAPSSGPGVWSQRVATVLKFYPFRLADLFLPLGVAWGSALLVAQRCGHNLCYGVIVSIVLLVSVVPSPIHTVRRDERLTPELWEDWQTACQWIRQSTPTESMFVTPTFSRHFKWWAERAEFVCHKDCPQDAPGILEWRRRMNVWRTWRPAAFVGGISAAELQTLGRLTGATHLLIHAAVDVRASPIYRNRTFAVYPLTAEPAPPSN